MHAVKKFLQAQAILALNAHEREIAWNSIASFQRGRTPDGTRDAQALWHPVQRFACCAQVRTPTPEAPQSLFVHCASLRHHEACALDHEVQCLSRSKGESV